MNVHSELKLGKNHSFSNNKSTMVLERKKLTKNQKEFETIINAQVINSPSLPK